MTEELEVLTIVAGRLEAVWIAYMVTGSFAANYYAVPRMTRDINLVVELPALFSFTYSQHRLPGVRP